MTVALILSRWGCKNLISFVIQIFWRKPPEVRGGDAWGWRGEGDELATHRFFEAIIRYCQLIALFCSNSPFGQLFNRSEFFQKISAFAKIRYHQAYNFYIPITCFLKRRNRIWCTRAISNNIYGPWKISCHIKKIENWSPLFTYYQTNISIWYKQKY